MSPTPRYMILQTYLVLCDLIIVIQSGGEPRVFESAEGGRITPSIVAFLPDGERLVGVPARAQVRINLVRKLYRINVHGSQCFPGDYQSRHNHLCS